MNLTCKVAALLIAASVEAAFAQTACVSHFNNASNYEWSISGAKGDNTSLVVAANSSIVIPWSNATSVVISGKIPNRPYSRQFDVQVQNGCYVVVRKGNSGNVILNKPDPGSVTTCSGTC